MFLTKKQIEAKFPIGTSITVNKANIKFIIQQGMELDLVYQGNTPATETIRKVRFYSYGTGNGYPWHLGRNYIRFWHLSGTSFSLGVASQIWRAALQSNIISISWTGNRFRTAPATYKYGYDKYLNLIEWWTSLALDHNR